MIRYNGQAMKGKVEGGRWKVEGTKNNIDRMLDYMK
jgi:hypothetical protein